MFDVNSSESQTYSNFYHCQANIPTFSPYYVPPTASVQTCNPMKLTTPSRTFRFSIDFVLIYPKKYHAELT